MGTRNLACVVLNGEYKLARYCQWDGYLEGQGVALLKFLREEFNREKFLAGLSKVQVISKDALKQLWVDAGAPRNSDMVTMDVGDKFEKAHPELSRNPTHASVFQGIQNGTVRWSNPDLNFAGDSLFCEWCYVVDLDKNTFEIYEGFNTTPLDASERFVSLPVKPEKGHSGSTYYPVRLLKSYSLRRLPSDKTFINLRTFSEQQEAEEKRKKNSVAA